MKMYLDFIVCTLIFVPGAYCKAVYANLAEGVGNQRDIVVNGGTPYGKAVLQLPPGEILGYVYDQIQFVTLYIVQGVWLLAGIRPVQDLGFYAVLLQESCRSGCGINLIAILFEQLAGVQQFHLGV